MIKQKYSICALLAVGLFATMLTGCGRKGLVKINGDKVSKEEFYARLEKVPVQTRTGTKMAGQYVIEQIINEKLIEQYAKDKGVAPTDGQIEKKLKYLQKQNPNLQNSLAQSGMTKEDLKNKIRVEQAFVNVISKGNTVPDAEVKKVYNQTLNMKNSPFKRPEQARISVIVGNTKEKIDKAYKMLKDGNPFPTVAMQLSDDPSGKAAQGQIPKWLERNEKGIPPIVMITAFNQTGGTYSAPVKVQKQWIIIQTEQKRPAKVTPYEEVKDTIREQLAIRQGTMKGQFKDDLRKFIKESNIVVNSVRYKGIADSIKKQAAESPNSMAPGDTTPTK